MVIFVSRRDKLKLLVNRLSMYHFKYAPSGVMSSCVSATLQGLAELVHGQQPTFSLVSNGAEFIMIDKRFYVDHAPQALMRRLRAEVILTIYLFRPRPSSTSWSKNPLLIYAINHQHYTFPTRLVSCKC